ncbi:hypothetical protein HK405_003069, partial [Cladochytrium tenue]
MAHLARNLEFVRLALDDEQSDAVLRCSRTLSDKSILYFAGMANLRHFSITWCKNMNVPALAVVFRTCPNIIGLELERYAQEEDIGLLSSDFLDVIRDYVSNLEVVTFSSQ